MDVQDRLDAAETIARLGHTVDQGHLDRLDTVFTPDAVYDMSAVHLPEMHGIDAIRSGALQLGAQNPVAHHVTDIMVIDAEGDTATMQSKGLMLTIEGAMRSVTHVDVLRRTPEGWRIQRRTLIPQNTPLGDLVDGITETKRHEAHR